MFELVLHAPQALVERIGDALADELDALSVSVEDSDADTEAEQALFGEPGLPAPAAAWARSTLRALFAERTQAEAAATRLLAQDWA
ncbi:MAG: 50S ribosomal protein L11 methyltransferase, partial [Rubrivivax sp.]|nr:50S ribosomal protein L11 methyltransferase [Rubrivivax sp.]